MRTVFALPVVANGTAQVDNAKNEFSGTRVCEHDGEMLGKFFFQLAGALGTATTPPPGVALEQSAHVLLRLRVFARNKQRLKRMTVALGSGVGQSGHVFFSRDFLEADEGRRLLGQEADEVPGFEAELVRGQAF